MRSSKLSLSLLSSLAFFSSPLRLLLPLLPGQPMECQCGFPCISLLSLGRSLSVQGTVSGDAETAVHG